MNTIKGPIRYGSGTAPAKAGRVAGPLYAHSSRGHNMPHGRRPNVTPAEDDVIRAMKAKHAENAEIAAALDRPLKSINNRIRTLGLAGSRSDASKAVWRKRRAEGRG